MIAARIQPDRSIRPKTSICSKKEEREDTSFSMPFGVFPRKVVFTRMLNIEIYNDPRTNTRNEKARKVIVPW